MNIASLIVVFTMIWWLLFFMMLPFGVKVNQDVQPGHADSAPSNPNLRFKAVVTTIITAILTGLFYYLVENGILNLQMFGIV
jgi:predicted secreted protein